MNRLREVEELQGSVKLELYQDRDGKIHTRSESRGVPNLEVWPEYVLFIMIHGSDQFANLVVAFALLDPNEEPDIFYFHPRWRHHAREVVVHLTPLIAAGMVILLGRRHPDEAKRYGTDAYAMKEILENGPSSGQAALAHLHDMQLHPYHGYYTPRHGLQIRGRMFVS